MLGVVAHTVDSSTQEAEASLHGKFQANQSYIIRFYLRQTNRQSRPV